MRSRSKHDQLRTSNKQPALKQHKPPHPSSVRTTQGSQTQTMHHHPKGVGNRIPDACSTFPRSDPAQSIRSGSTWLGPTSRHSSLAHPLGASITCMKHDVAPHPHNTRTLLQLVRSAQTPAYKHLVASTSRPRTPARNKPSASLPVERRTRAPLLPRSLPLHVGLHFGFHVRPRFLDPTRRATIRHEP